MALRLLITVLLLALPAANTLADTKALNAVIDAHWAFELEQDPVFATSVGERAYDTLLADLSIAAMDARKARHGELLAQLDAIKTETLTTEETLNHRLLSQTLRDSISALSFPQRAMIFNRFIGWHIAIANLPDRVPFETLADYQSYIARLNAFPKQNAQAIATTRTAIAQGMVHACAALDGYDQTIAAQITTQPSQSRFWQPFQARPKSISQTDWNALTADARKAIGDQVMPALRLWLKVYKSEYLANCQKEVGAQALARGDDYYKSRIKYHTSTDLGAREIHQIGLSQVSRIRREMRSIMDAVKFDGRFSEFQAFLRTDPRFYPKTGQELLEKTALIAKRADGELTKLFGHLPRMPYTIKAIPAAIAPGYTTAYYEQPSGDGMRPGVYRVNLTALDQRPLFEMEALTLHEAVPGHHLQIAIQQELTGVPNFRRYGGDTAFTEGWGLYAERLGLEMGFYQDPYANFGRLSYEMWRACGLVVDTGVHALGWGRQQAIDFMADNTALSESNITAEVDRYITWPGQALAYKLGERQLRAMRALAEDTLGDTFDIRSFHDVVLSQGAIPLNLVEERVRDWIRSQGGSLPQERSKPSEGQDRQNEQGGGQSGRPQDGRKGGGGQRPQQQ